MTMLNLHPGSPADSLKLAFAGALDQLSDLPLPMAVLVVFLFCVGTRRLLQQKRDDLENQIRQLRQLQTT
jgi:hypothetical protein